MPYPKGELFSSYPERLFQSKTEVLLLNNSQHVMRLVELVVAGAIVISDYGQTHGIVFKPSSRVEVARLRNEKFTEGDPNSFARASLTAVPEVVRSLIPDDMWHELFCDVTDQMIEVGFVQFHPNQTPFTTDEVIQQYFTSEGGIQLFPTNMAIAHEWRRINPDSPAFGVRSANLEGNPEQPHVGGIIQLAEQLNIPLVGFLSDSNFTQCVEDEVRLINQRLIDYSEDGQRTEKPLSARNLRGLNRPRMYSVAIVGLHPGVVTEDMVEQDLMIFDGKIMRKAEVGDLYQLSTKRTGNIKVRTLTALLSDTLVKHGAKLIVFQHHDPSHRTQYDPRDVATTQPLYRSHENYQNPFRLMQAEDISEIVRNIERQYVLITEKLNDPNLDPSDRNKLVLLIESIHERVGAVIEAPNSKTDPEIRLLLERLENEIRKIISSGYHRILAQASLSM